jgi:hypothetical protein
VSWFFFWAFFFLKRARNFSNLSENNAITGRIILAPYFIGKANWLTPGQAGYNTFSGISKKTVMQYSFYVLREVKQTEHATRFG